MDDKNPLFSKTLWFNVLTFAASVLTVLSGAANHIPAEAMPWIVGALAAVNFALRFVTDKPLKFGG